MMDVRPINLESLRRDLDALRGRVLAQLGEEDAQYLKSVRLASRSFEISGRLLIHMSLEPVSFGLGVLSLALHKILADLALGHNVMHGQYDFLNDPRFHSRTYEWGAMCSPRSWQRAHNLTHHDFANVLGLDPDFGFGYARMSSDLPWRPRHLLQALSALPVALLFDPLLAALYTHEQASAQALDTGEQKGEGAPAEAPTDAERRAEDRWRTARQAARHCAREYLFYPLLAGPFAPKVALGNLLASALRNVWCALVLHTGHLPHATHTFVARDLQCEGRGAFYLRQLLASSNVELSPLFSVLAGHMDRHIEHHLFPDLPAWRYRELAPEVRRIAERHGLPYQTGGFAQQLGAVLRALLSYALPGSPSDEPRRGAGMIRKLTPRAALQPASM